MIKIFYYLASTILSPVLILFGGAYMIYRKIWSLERLGVISQEKKEGFKSSIWLHAASVGEVNVILPILQEYLLNPKSKIIVSTMTISGQKYLIEKCGKDKNRIGVILLPLDIWFIWRMILKQLKPQKFIIAETELWPALLFEAAYAKIPLSMVNARISDKSFSSYLKTRFFFSGLLQVMKVIYTQSEVDKSRLIAIGAKPENVKVIGNIKNDGLRQMLSGKITELEFFSSHQRVVVGSLRPKELSFVVEVIQKLRGLSTEIKIIICPRHFDWLSSLYYEFDKLKISYQIASKDGFVPKNSDVTVLIIDQIGFLQRAYVNAVSAFVGGTLFAEYGGHNCLEPAALGVPVFHGPHFLEQLANTNALLINGGSKIVNSATEFVAEVEKMILYPAENKHISKCCLETVQLESRAIDELKKDNFFVT